MSALYPQKWNATMGELRDKDGKMNVQARVWQRGLSGITGKQLANAIDYLTDNYSPFIPDLGEFKKLCVIRNDLPTLDRCVMVLSHIQQRKGTVAERFEHPLILAINAHGSFDFHLFMQMDTKNCKSHLKPIYDDLAANGFPEFLPEHFENQIAIERILTEEEKAEAEAEKQRKAEVAAEARKQLFSFGKVLVDDEPVKKPAIDTNERLRREQSAEPTPEQIAERAARKAVLQAQAKMLMEKSEQEELANA